MLFKAVLIFSIVFTFTGSSFSQFNIGFSAEVSSSKFGGVAPENATYESILGVGGSLIGEVKLTKDVYLSFQPGFLTNGSSIKFGNENNLINDTVITFKVSQSYFTLPLNIKIFKNNFYAGGGFAFNFISSANIENEDSGNEQDIKDKFKSYDFVSNFNVGYQISLGKPNLFFELRYLQGLVNINNQNTVSKDDIYIANFKTKGFSFITGLIYPIK